MGRYTGTLPQAAAVVSLVPVGSVASVFRSGDAYKGVGEVVQRSIYTALSAAYPRNGSVSSIALDAGTTNPSVGVAYGAGRFVSLTASGQTWFSNDGRTWVLGAVISAITSRSYSAIAFGNGLFVAIAGGATGNTTSYATSPDGLTWTVRTMPDSYWAAITFGGGLFVATAWGSNAAATSPDGLTWTARTMPSSANWACVIYGGGLYLAISNSTAAATSTDGINWTSRTMPANGSGWSAAYGNGLYVAAFDATSLCTSPDGITWTLRQSSLFNGGLGGVTFANGIFVAFHSGGAIVSYDGIAWLRKSTALSVGSARVAYSAGLFAVLNGVGSSTAALAFYAENLTDSDYLYLSGTPGTFVRVK